MSLASINSLTGNGPESATQKKRRESNVPLPTLSIEFEGGTHVIIRPNRVIRGKIDNSNNK